MGERAKIDPALMFKNSDDYSEWDESGIPTADAKGNVVSKNRRKKLLKEWEQQNQRYQEWLMML
jgi:cysteinyl-tRNA synthetase